MDLFFSESDTEHGTILMKWLSSNRWGSEKRKILESALLKKIHLREIIGKQLGKYYVSIYKQL